MFSEIILVLLLSHISSFRHHAPYLASSRGRNLQQLVLSSISTPPPDETDKRIWTGSTAMLKRRGQVPLPQYTPIDVIQICLTALQINDDPQLDHGACVLLEFKSPNGPLSAMESPLELGNFLRNEDYRLILDFRAARLVGELAHVPGTTESVKQTVEIIDWTPSDEGEPKKSLYDFYLSKIADTWLVDALIRTPKKV